MKLSRDLWLLLFLTAACDVILEAVSYSVGSFTHNIEIVVFTKTLNLNSVVQ